MAPDALSKLGTWLRGRAQIMAAPDAASPTAAIVEADRWLLRRGLPTMLLHRSDPDRVWHRASPAIVAVNALLLLPYSLVNDSSGLRAIRESLAGIVVFLATWGTSNLRWRRPLFSLPDRIGTFERVAFVFGPIIALVIGGTLDVNVSEASELLASRTMIALALLALSICVTSLILITIRQLVASGLVAMTVFVIRRLISSVLAVTAALSRTLPLILAVVSFFFFTAEVWQAVGNLGPINYTLLTLLFVGVGGWFLGSRQEVNLDAIGLFESEADLVDALDNVGLAGVNTPAEFPATCDLTWRQRANLRLVVVLTRMIMAVLIAAAVGLCFGVIGVAAIDAEVVNAWTTKPGWIILQWKYDTGELVLTWQHIKVSGFLATFSGFYFAVVSSTDTALRQGLRDNAIDTVRSACAIRVALDAEPPTSHWTRRTRRAFGSLSATMRT